MFELNIAKRHVAIYCQFHVLKFLIDDCMSFWPFLAIKRRLLGVPENLVASVLYFRYCQIALIILHKVLSSGFSMTWERRSGNALTWKSEFLRNSKTASWRVYIRTRAMFWCWLGRDSWHAIKPGLSNSIFKVTLPSVDKDLRFNFSTSGGAWLQ